MDKRSSLLRCGLMLAL